MKRVRIKFLKGKKKFRVKPLAIIMLFAVGMLLGGLIGELMVRGFVQLPLDPVYMKFRSLPSFDIPYNMLDKDLFWKSSHEFRDVLYDPEKKPGIFRIVCLGDSVTQSHGRDGTPLRREETYVYHLEKLLNDNGGASWAFELLNAGVGGYSSFQGAKYLELRLLKYNPDLIISWFGINDNAEAFFFADKDQRFSSDLVVRKGRFGKFSKLYRFLKNVVFPEKIKRVSPEDFYENSRRMLELSKRKKINIAFVIPFRLKEDKIECISEYKKALEKLKNETDCVLFDVGASLARNPSVDRFFIDGVHATAEGNALIARIIFELINDYKSRLLLTD